MHSKQTIRWDAKAWDYQVELDEVSLAEIREDLTSAQPVGCLLRHFLPQLLALGVDLVTEDTHAILSLLGGEGFRGYPRRMSVDRQQMIAVPTPVIEKILQFAGEVDVQDEDLRTILLRELEGKQLSLIGEETLPLERLFEALRSLQPRTRMENPQEAG